MSIPYASLWDVRAGGITHDPATYRRSKAPIRIEHDGGVLDIPARLNIRSDQLYRFLASRVTTSGDRAVNPALAEYLERQEGYFGPEHIGTYRASTGRMRRIGRYRGLRAVCIGLMLGGAAWMVEGFSGLAETTWGGAGIFCSLIGVCFYLVTLAEVDATGRFIKNWKNCSLVIGPQGMAMVQGDIQGEVRWPELLEVKFRAKPAAFRLHHSQGLNGVLLKVKGADVLIADIDDRPLYVIYDQIMTASGRSTEDVVDL